MRFYPDFNKAAASLAKQAALACSTFATDSLRAFAATALAGLGECEFVDVRLSMARWNLDFHKGHSPLVRYGFAIVCVAQGLGLALALEYYGVHNVELPVLAISIAFVTWYAGLGPSALAVVLATACFDYFFVEPLYSLEISSSDIPYFLVFVVWAVIVASFAAIRRRIEENLRHARAELADRATQLEAANKELEAFTYSVSHDLRAPLRHIAGYAELLQKQASSSLDDKSRRYMKAILEAAKKMGDLIDNLLGFSRIGRAETKSAPVNLEQLAREVVAEFRQETGGRDIVWKIGALPVCYGDRSMLKLVLVNLVANAVKFSGGRSRAEIEIGCARQESHEAEIFVKDNGAGFDMQYANKLFGVFQRLHLPEEFEGTGIGLATVQRIVHRHGGKTRAEGERDRGATFYFSLPKA
jgi:K+-sensing histidine kinase KdpD